MGSYIRAALEQKAYRAWASGKVVPDRITTALDGHGLYGPEVDEACGVEEPAVDEWEAGTRYPTWEQLHALAKLVDLPVHVFTMDSGVVTRMIVCETSGCTVIERNPVLAFTPEAITAANLPKPPKPPTSPLPPTGRRRLRRVA
jgi:hypothetical protein